MPTFKTRGGQIYWQCIVNPNPQGSQHFGGSESSNKNGQTRLRLTTIFLRIIVNNQGFFSKKIP